MLIKLIKHELKSSYRNYILVFAAILIATAILSFTLTTDSINAIAMTTLVTVVLVTVLYVLVFRNIFLSLGERIYGKSGYLLFTIPAKTRDIVISRLIANFLWIVVSTAIGMLPVIIFVGYISKGFNNLSDGQFGDLLNQFLLGLLGLEENFTVWDAIVSVLQIMFETVSWIATVFISYTIANTLYKGDRKKLVVFVLFVTTIIVLSFISNLSIFRTKELIPTNDPEYFIENFYRTTSQKAYLALFKMVISIGFFFISGYLIEKKLELQ